MLLRIVALLIILGKVPVAEERSVSSRLDDLEKRMYSLEQSMNFVLKEFVVPEEISTDVERFSKRFARAETLFYLQDYQSASILVYDIVEDAANEREPHYWDAVNLLAESLFRIKNYYGAKNYFNKLISKGDKRYFYNALERVISISSITGNYEGIERYFSIVKQLPNSSLTSSIYFSLGRTLYRRGDLSRAQEIFNLIDKGSEYYINSRFYMGVIEIKKGLGKDERNFGNALQIFREILSLEPQTPEHRDLKEQAILAIGRIFYEQGKFSEAIDTYQGITRESPHFEEALYEIAWVYVKSNDLKKAKQTLEIMLLSTNETPVLLNAKALYGSVMMKMGEYDSALENFQETVDRYYPVKEQLRSILEEKDNPVEFFEELLLKEPDGMALKKVLPPVAFNWATTDSKVKKAFSISTDVKGNVSSIDEVAVLADVISAKLDSADKVAIFPQLKEAKLRASEIKLALDEIRIGVMNIRTEIVDRYISNDEKKNLEDVRRKKSELRGIVDSLPRDTRQIEEKEREIIKRISAMETVVHQLTIVMEGIKAQLFAVEKWLNDNAGRLGEKEREADFANKIKIEWNNVKAMEHDIAIYSAEIKKERGRIGTLSVLSEDESKRLELKKVEEEERRLLDNYKNRLSREDTKILNRVDNLLVRLAQHEEQFKKFDSRIDMAVDKKARHIKETIEKERQNLAEYKRLASSMIEDSRELIGKMGYSGFRQVNRLFSDLVLKADVGLVDVVWKQKEEIDKKIGKLREDQDKELKEIQDEFNIDFEK